MHEFSGGGNGRGGGCGGGDGGCELFHEHDKLLFAKGPE